MAKARTTANARKSTVNAWEVRALLLYADNTGPGSGHPPGRIYSQGESIKEALAKRYRKGTYDHAKAPKFWSYWMDTAAKSYKKDSNRPVTLSKATRDAAAKEKADEFYEQLKLDPGAYENPRKKKATKRKRKTNPGATPAQREAMRKYMRGA